MAYQLFHVPKAVPLSDGDVLSGAKAYFYLTGTTTPQAVYSDSGLTTPLTNPVVADSEGTFPTIYLNPSVQYKLTLKTSADVLLYTVDPINDQILSSAIIGQILFGQTSAEQAASVTPSSYAIQPQNPLPKRYGAAGDGATDDTAAITRTALVNSGSLIDLGGLTYKVTCTLPASPLPSGARFYNGEFTCPQTVIPSIDRYSVTAFGAGSLLANQFVPEQEAAGGGINYAWGNHIVAIGTDAMRANTHGRRMVAVGSRALLSNTTGYYNTGVGSHALEVCTTGFENTALGVQALQNLTTGSENVGIGPLAAGLTTTGTNNVAVGRSALRDNTTSSNNTAVGYQAALTVTSSNNAAFGTQALSATTTGDRNTSVGASSLGSNVTGSQLTAVGYRALLANTANNNSAFGCDALISNTSGTKNAAFGFSALSSVVTGQNNCAFGDVSLTLCTGDNNTGFGTESLTSCTTGLRNTAIGYTSLSSLATYDNCAGVGFNAQVTGSNQVQLGDSNTTTYAYGAVQNRSDIRDKADVRDTELGLDFINALHPVDFRWDYREDYGWGERDGSKKRSRFHHGLIAQEVREVMERTGLDFGGYQDHSKSDGKDVQSLGYEELIAPLIRAVQQLSARVAELESKAA